MSSYSNILYIFGSGRKKKILENDLDSLVELEKKYNAKLVTTEKDFLRISKYNRGNITYVPITLKIDNENEFTDLVDKILK